MNQKIKDYKVVKEQGKQNILTIVLILIIISFGILNYFLDFFDNNWLLILLFIFVATFHVYRNRKCPICSKRMERDFSEGPIPRFYFCDKDKVKIDNKIEHGD